MSKELTEQWRNGTLPEDCYYILDKNGHIRKERTCFYSHTDEQCFSFISNKNIEEVLTPVPSYHDLCELKQELEICKEEKADLYAKLCNALMQLEEANKVIKEFVKPEPFCILCTEEIEKLPESNEIKVAKEYLERYGVK